MFRTIFILKRLQNECKKKRTGSSDSQNLYKLSKLFIKKNLFVKVVLKEISKDKKWNKQNQKHHFVNNKIFEKNDEFYLTHKCVHEARRFFFYATTDLHFTYILMCISQVCNYTVLKNVLLLQSIINQKKKIPLFRLK